MKRSIALVVSGLLLVAPAILRAQVGYSPEHSPFHDLQYSQELTVLAGEFFGHRDAANAAPRHGPLVGVRYAWHAGGPANLFVEITQVSANQQIVVPTAAGAAQRPGSRTVSLSAADAGVALNVTGAKSWHRLVPEVAGGMGVVSDLGTASDSGGYKFGTRFALTGSAGIRYVPGGRWQVRADVKDRLYTIGYPNTYYTAPTGGTAVIPPTQSKSFWTNNPALTLGLSFLF